MLDHLLGRLRAQSVLWLSESNKPICLTRKNHVRRPASGRRTDATSSLGKFVFADIPKNLPGIILISAATTATSQGITATKGAKGPVTVAMAPPPLRTSS